MADESRAVLANLPLLGILPADVKALVVNSFVPMSLSFGSLIIREGDEADALYVLNEGRARVLKRSEQGEEIPLTQLAPGDYFGEIGLILKTTRTATVRASSDVGLFRLDRSVLDALIHDHPEIHTALELQVKRRSLSDFLRLYSPFANLPAPAMQTLLAELEPIAVNAGQKVIREGDNPGPMYVVDEGRLRVYTRENGQRRYRSFLRKGDFFGELSLFRGTQRTATVEAVTPCRLLELTPETFHRLLHGFPEFRAQIEQRIRQYDYQKVARVPADFPEELLPASLSVFELVGLDQVDKQVGELAEQIEESAADLGPEAAGPFASPNGQFVKKGRRRRWFPHVRQVDEMDCGAACLAMVCRHFGRSVSLARIRQLVHTSLDGTSLRALCTAANELGLAARAVKATTDNLMQMPLPAIVHWEGNHWVVLYDVTKRHVRISDPATGLRRLPRAEFEKKWSGFAALYDYTTDFEKAPVGQPSLSWLWPFLRPFVGTIAQATGLALLVSALEMVLPIFTQIIVDKVLVEKDVNLLHMLLGCMGAVAVFMTLALIVQRYLLSFIAVRVDAATLDFLTRKMLALPLSYFQHRRTGDIQRRMEGVHQVRVVLVQNGVRALSSTVMIATALGLMLVYSPILTLVFLITAPLYGLLMIFSRRWLRPLFFTLEDAFGKYHSYQIDAIKGIETVKAMGGEGALRELMLKQFLGIAGKEFKSDFTILCYQAAIQTVTFLTTMLFLGFGAYQVMEGRLTIGGLVAFNALVALANAAILTLLPVWDSVQHASVLLNRLHDVFETEPEQGADHSRLKPVRSLEGRIRFHNLGFQYGGPESPKILEGLSFEVPPGKTVAIVGRSGSGKTTLIKCLAGLLEPTEGTIFYDGVDLKTLNYHDLRRQIGFVLQENYLFGDTIARNIAFGEDEPDMDGVLWAARAANAQEFIERLPLGYETKIGETGLALSGGQRQRVAIARALYYRPPVLIFDEATSSLDTESERAVKENLDQLLKGRTSFVIAHRLSTIRDADLILVLEKGKLVEQGNHEQLMERQGLYYYLCSQQLGL
jgi:ATP-binding cassette subfamily B protein